METIAVDTTHQTLSELLTQAREAMRGGQYGEVEQTCETIVEDHPGQPDAWFFLGVAALRNGKIHIAAPHLQRAVDMRRGYAPYRLALGQALLHTGGPATALIHFEDAQILTPRHMRPPSDECGRFSNSNRERTRSQLRNMHWPCCGDISQNVPTNGSLNGPCVFQFSSQLCPAVTRNVNSKSRCNWHIASRHGATTLAHTKAICGLKKVSPMHLPPARVGTDRL